MRAKLIVVLALAACGSKHENTATAGSDAPKAPTPAPTIDAAPAPAPSADKPPAPTVKKNSKGDCRTDYAPKPDRDPNPMCKVDGGEFMMGTAEKDLPGKTAAWKAEAPAHRVAVAPYAIDQFEVTVAQVVFYLNQTKANVCDGERDRMNPDARCMYLDDHTRSPIHEDHGVYAAAPGTELEPFDMATAEGAAKYCAWAGKRLPTEAEWEFAARHDPKTGKDLTYPWGDTFEPRRANCENASCQDGFECTDTARCPFSKEMLSPVGSFDGTKLLDGSSPWGVHDLAGNARELVSDCYAPYTACKGACVDGGREAHDCKRVIRISDSESDPRALRPAARAEAGSAVGGAEAGFRCAR